MSFVSYARNCEDVMLARALRGVEKGFYIDVGAKDPIGDSVTKAFYERGWRGVNIEPVTHWFKRLVEDRSRDINLQLVVSDHSGVLHLFEVVDTGLSTTERKLVERHVGEGHQIRESDVRCDTLNTLCEQYQVDEVHFLKVDCEGAETAALRGLSLDRVRPWIILIKATEPDSQRLSYEEWEPLLTGRGYHFVYRDGLNRFYVADEHGELDRAFAYPPSVLDYFVRATEAAAREELATAREQLAALHDRVAHLHGENERREVVLAELRRQLEGTSERLAARRSEALHLRREVESLRGETGLRDQELARLRAMVEATSRSTSWRVTHPLRLVRRGVYALSRLVRRPAYRMLRWPARLARPLLRVLARSALLRLLFVRIAGSDSWLASRTRLFLFGASPGASDATSAHSGEPVKPLTRRALQMLDEIGDALKRGATAGGRSQSGEG